MRSISIHFPVIVSKHECKTSNSVIFYCMCGIFSSQRFSKPFPVAKGVFPERPSSPAVWAREITHLSAGSSIDTHMPASQEALPGLARRFIHKSLTHKHTQAQSITSAPSRWNSVCRSETLQHLTGNEKVRGQLKTGFKLGSVWVVLGVYENRNWIILWLQMYPLHLQMELR